ncbi:hypothetical protein KIPB_006936, partial [Kipferlia bialata]|eukprot:g6936.t1
MLRNVLWKNVTVLYHSPCLPLSLVVSPALAMALIMLICNIVPYMTVTVTEPFDIGSIPQCVTDTDTEGGECLTMLYTYTDHTLTREGERERDGESVAVSIVSDIILSNGWEEGTVRHMEDPDAMSKYVSIGLFLGTPPTDSANSSAHIPLEQTDANLDRYGLGGGYLKAHSDDWLPSYFTLHLEVTSDHQIQYEVTYNSTQCYISSDPLVDAVGRPTVQTGRGLQIQHSIETSIARVFSQVDIDMDFQPYPEVTAGVAPQLRIDSMSVMGGLTFQLILATAIASLERNRLVSMRGL